MKSISKFLGAAALAAAIVPAAFAESPNAGGPALEGAQPAHQHRYVQIGRDRTWVHLDRAAEPRTGDASKASGQPDHEHRYVQVGRDRTWVHLDRSRAGAASSDARLMGSAPAPAATPSSQDLVGGPN